MSISDMPRYQIDRPEPSDLFLNARQIAGSQLQAEFNKNKGRVSESRDYKWIKAELTYPSFDHLTFGYGNQVFSVLVDICDAKGSQLTHKERDRFIRATSDNNLVPCRFQIMLPSLKPISKGWNLTHFTTGKNIVPIELSSHNNIPMSEWELRNFSIQVVRNHIERDRQCKILSFCDVLQIDPQIWFEDNGKRCWVIVRHVRRPDDGAISNWVGLANSSPQLKAYDGFFAGVSLASSAPILRDSKGDLIPLSERFSGKVSLYRGDGFFVKFEGLQRLHDSSNSDKISKQLNGNSNPDREEKKGIMDMEMIEHYEVETLPPPEGVNPPEHFGYIHFKAYKYLKIGPDAYSAQDALGMPPRGALPSLLALVEQGCRQIVDWRGLSPERPLQGLGINGFYRMIEVFHFKLAEQSATFGDDGSVMDKMTIKHSVTGEQITLYNLVKKG